jgi:hypothetical protein
MTKELIEWLKKVVETKELTEEDKRELVRITSGMTETDWRKMPELVATLFPTLAARMRTNWE